MKSEFLEIERKYMFSASQWNEFIYKCIKRTPTKQIFANGPDVYYTNQSYIIRWRHSGDLNELTIKSRHSKSNTLIRDEIDLNVKKNSPKTISKFLDSLGFKKLFTITKKCHVFYYKDLLGELSVVIYTVSCPGFKDQTFVEIEPKKGLESIVAKKLINKWEKILGLKPWRRLNSTLFEIYSKGVKHVRTKKERRSLQKKN